MGGDMHGAGRSMPPGLPLHHGSLTPTFHPSGDSSSYSKLTDPSSRHMECGCRSPQRPRESCAAALQQTVGNYGILDTASLQAVLLFDAAGFARALCTALQVEPPAAQQSTATDEKVLMVDAASQTTDDDMVDTATAEAMVAEALSMVSEAEERERAGEERRLVGGWILHKWVLHSSERQKSAPTVHRQNGRRLRHWQQLSTLPGR